MTARKTNGRRAASRAARGERLKDEVYRQMFLLEEGRPGAAIGLAVALLHAWIDVDSKPLGDEDRGWLSKVSPICLQMIEASMKAGRNAHPCVQ